MKRRRLITPLAVVLMVLVAGALVAWGLSGGSSMFSPGALNAQAGGPLVTLGGVSTHASLGNDCAACHATRLSPQTMAEKCSGCHRDVQQEMGDGSGLHGKMAATGWSGNCDGCHTEHHGAAGALTVLSESFPHDLTGYSLRAHNGETTCADCHEQGPMAFDQKTCANCHQRLDQTFLAAHIAAFGPQCVPCHDGVDRYGPSFDHNKIAFPLAGAHADVPCASCHKDATTVEALENTPQDCYSCHAKDDAHKGEFGRDCAGCHTATSWQDATFDHTKTSFPLAGAHADIPCDKCHANGKFRGTSAECVSCHAEPAFHAEGFGAEGRQCASCHSATSWTPAEFGLPHSFPLDHGSEEQTPNCKTCHPTTVTSYTCLGCHAHTPDSVMAEHQGAPLAQLQDCARCHAGGGGGD